MAVRRSVTTTANGTTHRKASREDGRKRPLARNPPTRSGRLPSGLVWSDLGANGAGARRAPCAGAPAPGRLPQAAVCLARPPAKLGRTPAIFTDRGGGRGLFETLVGKCRRRKSGGRGTAASGPGAAAGPGGQTRGGLSTAGPAWLVPSGSRHAPSQEPARSAGGVEKNSPRCWKPCSRQRPSRVGASDGCFRTRLVAGAWCGFGAAGHPPRCARWWTTVTSARSRRFMERSVRGKGRWTGCLARPCTPKTGEACWRKSVRPPRQTASS